MSALEQEAPAARPYRDHIEWDRDQERVVLLMLQSFAAREHALGPFGDPKAMAEAVGDAEGVARLVSGLTKPVPADSEAAQTLADLREYIGAREASSDFTPPLPAMAERLDLSVVAVDILRLLWRVQTSPRVDRLARALWRDPQAAPIGVDFLLAVLGDSPRRRADLQEALTQRAPLRLFGLLQYKHNVHLRFPSVALPEAVIDVLAGVQPPLSMPFRWCPEHPSQVPPELLVSQSTWEEFVRALDGDSAPEHPRLMLVAPAGASHDALLAGLAARDQRPCVACDLDALVRAQLAGRDPLDHGLRDVVISGAWLAIDVPSHWPKDAGAMVAAVASKIADLPTTVIVRCEESNPLTNRLTQGFRKVKLDPLTLDERTTLWMAASPSGVKPPKLRDVRNLLSTFVVSPEATLLAAATAAQRAIEDGASRVRPEDLAAGCQQQLDTGFAGLASKVETHFDWDDLILPPECEDQLREVLLSCTHRSQVMDDWGFSGKMPYGQGMTVMFSGPSGTGKTMAATIIARKLDQPIYRVDLSQIFDRYVGETEKNLARIFEAARAGHAIILFDEADSLFSQRTDVRSANDRYANLEVNYLLQRIEHHRGIVILTTNMDSSIDDAFRRRIRFTVRFQEPDVETREVLWRSMMPDQADVSDDIDWPELAYSFELPGGAIKNAVLCGAFLAAGDGTPITTDHLMRAGRAECAALGKLVRAPPTPKR